MKSTRTHKICMFIGYTLSATIFYELCVFFLEKILSINTVYTHLISASIIAIVYSWILCHKHNAYRTYADVTAALHEKKTELETLHNEQQQMILDISHELQTPLTILKGELHFLKEHSANIKDIEVLEKTVEGLSIFIYDLLRLARMDSVKTEFTKTLVDLSALLRELIEYFEVLMNEQDIKCIHVIDDNIRTFGQKEKLEEMIVNIVSNSMKYMHPHSRDKKILLKLSATPTHCSIIIEDNGIGMNPEILPHIFDRFYRSTKHIQKRGGVRGSGLGLAIVKKIVDKHDGTIAVESTLNIGTRFIITLPRAQ